MDTKSETGRFGGDKELAKRFKGLVAFTKKTRTMLVHVTNKCNLRCDGCWFYADEFEKRSQDIREIGQWRAFAKHEAERGINVGILIGGEPTLYPARVAAIRDYIPFVTVSTNGEFYLSRDDFPDVTIANTLFGGGPVDDDIRAIRPNRKRFSGLFRKVLDNYRNDPRAGFVYGLTEKAMPYMEETIQRIGDAGLRAMFNYYRDFSHGDNALETEKRLLDEALRLKDKYPDIVISHPYYITALLSGEARLANGRVWGVFGAETCPAFSQDYPGNAERLAASTPTLPAFNAYSNELKPIKCCNAGNCSLCRDSQAVSSWLLASHRHFLASPEDLRTWVEVNEAFWSQFIWTPYHPHHKVVFGDDRSAA
ncbi:MAG: radical SAM protein [Candidatus Thiodiazotropha sp. (ex Epidulcina cf. delphinae)]|nr:radical SAM protein [Candidatus Thiodiazotropha sp. (ex Epidulcina cf. delphinae)]